MPRSGRKRRRLLLLGVSLAVVFTAAVWLALTAQNGLPGATSTQVKAAFSNVGALRVGDDVRESNVRKGQVTQIQLVHGTPVVTMELDGHQDVHRNASAAVVDRSALGQKFVELEPGDARATQLTPDEVLPEQKTQGSQDISDLFQVFDPATRQALGSSVRQLGGGVLGHSDDLHSAAGALPQMLPDLGTVSKALSAQSGQDTTHLLHAANDLATSFQGRQRQLGALAGHLQATLGAVDVDQGRPLAESLRKAPDTLSRARGSLKQLQAPLDHTDQAMSALRPGADALGQATPDVRGVLRESVPPLERVPGVADQAQPAVESLTGTMRDARPLAPQVTRGLTTAQRPLFDIAPFSPEISLFFTNFADAMKDGDAAGHYLRIYPPVGPQSASGLAPVQDPTVSRDTYPAPGQAQQERKGGVLGDNKGAGR